LFLLSKIILRINAIPTEMAAGLTINEGVSPDALKTLATKIPAKRIIVPAGVALGGYRCSMLTVEILY